MTNRELKDQLGQHTEQLEQKLIPYYTSLAPYQRGILLLALALLLLISIYYLTKKEQPQTRELTNLEKQELQAQAEARILKRAEFLKRLRD